MRAESPRFDDTTCPAYLCLRAFLYTHPRDLQASTSHASTSWGTLFQCFTIHETLTDTLLKSDTSYGVRYQTSGAPEYEIMLFLF